VPVPEGSPPEGAPIQEGAPVPVGVLQRQGRTHKPNPRYFGLEWSNMAQRQTQKLNSWHTE